MSSSNPESRIPNSDNLFCIGKPLPRVDALDKIKGKTLYLDDLEFPNMLHGKCVFSTFPHAKIKSIDTKPALKLKGVTAVLTAKDIPGENQVGVVLSDQPLIASEKVRFTGDCIAIVAAETKKTAQEASLLVKAKFESLRCIFSPLDGIKKSAPKIHSKGNILTHLTLRKGDIKKGFAKSDIILEETFTTQHQEHMYLETQGTIAVPQPDGSITIYGSMQCPYYVQKAVARCLGIGFNKVRVVQTTTGGGFGGKEDIPSEICSRAAVLAWATKKPVKMVYDREEDVICTSKRHPIVMKYKIGAAKGGKLLALQIKNYADCGAYATLSPIVLYRSHIHAAGSYDIPTVWVDTIGVATNHPPCGAFRGFGQPQVAFASERMMDILAKKLNLDPINLRLKNALRKDSLTVTSHKLSESVSLIETIKKAREISNWDKKIKAISKGHRTISNHIKNGIGIASIFYGVSLGSKGWFLDRAGAHLQIWIDGTVNVAIGLTEMGQGALTVISQIAAEALGVSIDYIKIGLVDTSFVPDSGPTVASRTTLSAGKAVYNAACELRKKLIKTAAGILNVPENKVKIKVNKFYCNRKEVDYKKVVQSAINKNVNLSVMGWYQAPSLKWDEKTSQGEAYFIYSYATHIAEVEVNVKTGEVKVIKITAVHDLGKAINPQTIAGQIEGGVVQGMGLALYENLVIDKGVIKTPNLSTYTIPTALDIPEVESFLIEKPYSRGPYGAKGIGEPCLIPTAAAIANAVSIACGKPINKLPILPEDIVS